MNPSVTGDADDEGDEDGVDEGDEDGVDEGDEDGVDEGGNGDAEDVGVGEVPFLHFFGFWILHGGPSMSQLRPSFFFI